MFMNLYQPMYHRKAKKVQTLIYETLNLCCLDFPFLVIRVLMICRFDIESSTFLPKNIIFCFISGLRIILVKLDKKQREKICLPPGVQEFLLREIEWLESQYTEEEVDDRNDAQEDDGHDSDNQSVSMCCYEGGAPTSAPGSPTSGASSPKSR